MARIRTVKPEFWTSEQIMECSPNARLLFIGMWSFCDDGGNHPASAKTLKAEVFPADDFDTDDVSGWMQELVTQGLVLAYEANGKQFWHVTGWHRHQRIDQPTFKFPAPDGTLPATPGRRRGAMPRQEQVRDVFDEQSPNACPHDGERSGRDRNGLGKEQDRTLGGEPPKTPGAAAPSPAVSGFTLPDWVPAKPWADFETMRKKMGSRVPFTDAARDGILSKLRKLADEGQDAAAVLEASTRNGWRDVFAVKPDGSTFAARAPNGGARQLSNKKYDGGLLEADF
jgi:hypothetical protein